jgi:hypothetical protein
MKRLGILPIISIPLILGSLVYIGKGFSTGHPVECKLSIESSHISI